MEERKQLSVSDKNGILNELTRKGYTQEVVDLVKEDLDFGLSQEQTQLYLLKKLDIRQMRVQSQCMGLIKCGSVVIPFDNTISKDTEIYKLYNTNIHEKIAEEKAKKMMVE